MVITLGPRLLVLPERKGRGVLDCSQAQGIIMASLTHACRRAGAPAQLSDKQQEVSRPLRGPVGITEKHSPPGSQIPGRHGWRPNEGAGSLIEPKDCLYRG